MKDQLKKILSIFSRKDKFKLIGLFFLMLAEACLEIFGIGFIAAFISILDKPQVIFEINWLAHILNLLNINSETGALLFGAFSIIFLYILKNIFLLFSRHKKSTFVNNRYREIAVKLFDRYINAPYTFHLHRNSAELVRNVTIETLYFAEKVMFSSLLILTELVMMAAIITFLLYIEPVITIVGLVLLGSINLLLFKLTRKKLSNYGHNHQDLRTILIKLVNESIGGIKEITVLNRQQWFVDRLEKIMGQIAQTQIFRQTAQVIVYPIMEVSAVMGMLLISVYLLSQGRSIAELVSILSVFALAIYRLLPSINRITGEATELRFYYYSGRTISNDLKLLSTQINGDNNKTDQTIVFNKDIRFDNVFYKYPQTHKNVINGISSTIDQGSAVGIVGTTGAGKTTLADLVLGLLNPTSGTILVDDQDISHNIVGWREKIGYIPQFIFLADDSIRNNIAFGVDEESIDNNKIKQAISISQLDHLIKNLPNGVNTVIGERGIRLSGGQRQRIGIARALYNNAELLVMDEATSSLDNVTESELVKAIDSLKNKLTLIIIAHRLSTIKNCDKILLIDNGKLIAEGSYTKLLKHNKQFQKLAEIQNEK